MNITWYGQSCFRISLQGERKSRQKSSVVIDPFKETIGLSLPRLEADILLLTHDHHDHNCKEKIKSSFMIDSPGEYELRDIFIQGISSFHDKKKGEERGANIIYTLEGEDFRICHMGDFGQNELTDKQMQEIGNVDVLMIPVGGVYTIDAKEATTVISQLEPRVVIPMHYKIPGLKVNLDDLSIFTKAVGEKGVNAQEKLALQRKDLSAEEMKIIPLLPQAKKTTSKNA